MIDAIPELPFPLAMIALAATAWLVWRWPTMYHRNRDDESIEQFEAARRALSGSDPKVLP